MTRIPKKLMREFAKVCGLSPDTIDDDTYTDKRGVYYMLGSWRDVIELAAEWCEDGLIMQKMIDGKWRVFAGFNPPVDNKSLPRAIMEAVVAASREGKE